MLKNKKLWMAAAALAVFGAVAGLRWKKAADDKPRFREVAVERGDLRVTILATGVAQPQNRVEIKPPIAGRAEEIRVREGEAVRKGQVLALMSSTERAALLDAARAKGDEELAHWENLYKPTPLVAPLSGIVIARAVEPGQTVTSQDAVLVMSNRLIIKAQVDETDIGSIRVGQEAKVQLDAYPQQEIPARVDHIAYEAKTVNNVTVYEVEVAPARVPDFMRSGMTANVTFIIAVKENILLLPAEALQNEKGHTRVFLPSASKKRLDTRDIKTGVSDGKRVEVVSGMNEGEKVLVRQVAFPRAGAAKGGNNPFSPFGGRRGGGSGGQKRGGKNGS
ncbi:MAG: HlyD family efflux transporter periplasmic adaptor subunit [Elusimicrobia bacterium]|nr:HlyD family efflux transporter periplasmic adaptor subunit [Elusimicrobiota bacterium]